MTEAPSGIVHSGISISPVREKLPRFDDRDTALGKAGELDEHVVGFERQWDHSFGWLDMIRKPNRGSHRARGCLLPMSFAKIAVR